MLRREPTKIKLDQNDIARYDESKQQRSQEQLQTSQFSEASFEGSRGGQPADQNSRGGRTKEQRILGNASGRWSTKSKRGTLDTKSDYVHAENLGYDTDSMIRSSEPQWISECFFHRGIQHGALCKEHGRNAKEPIKSMRKFLDGRNQLWILTSRSDVLEPQRFSPFYFRESASSSWWAGGLVKIEDTLPLRVNGLSYAHPPRSPNFETPVLSSILMSRHSKRQYVDE